MNRFKYALVMFLMCSSFNSFSYDFYKIFDEYNTTEHKLKNRMIASCEQWIKLEKRKPLLIKKTYFNKIGLPDSVLAFDENSNISDRLYFSYDRNGKIHSILGTAQGIYLKNEFEYLEDNNTIIKVYLKLDDEFILFYTKYFVFKNGKPFEQYRIGALENDTTEYLLFNESGKELYARNMFYANNVAEQFWEWDEDMLHTEIFELDGGNKKLIETIEFDAKGNALKKMEPKRNTPSFYSVFDTEGKMIESFSFAYKTIYKYNAQGYLTEEIAENIFKESIDKNLPEFVTMEYKYHFR